MATKTHPVSKEIYQVTHLPNDIVDIIFYYEGTMEKILSKLKPDEVTSRFDGAHRKDIENMGGILLTKQEKGKSFKGIYLDQRRDGYTLCFVTIGTMGRSCLTEPDFDTLIPKAIKELIARKITPISYSKATNNTTWENYSNSANFQAWQRKCGHDLFMTLLIERKRIYDQLKDCDPEVITKTLDDNDKEFEQLMKKSED